MRKVVSKHWPALLAAALAVPSARAEVLAAGETGFATRTEVSIDAPPARVYERLLEVGRWWNDAHTYSGAARQMRLDARPGGCWCETLEKGGFVEHGRVVYAATGKTLRITAALGSLHEIGGSGSMTVQLASAGPGTKTT